jgi:hypothetical protein
MGGFVMLRKVLIAILAVGLAASSPALAKDDKGKGHGKGHDKDKDKGQERVVVVQRNQPARVVVFADRDREVIRTYYVDTYGRGGCPPGLAKKNNGCLPPGQAKKRYVVGRILPRTVVYEAVPTVLVERLTPVPVGYQYVMVDGDVLKLAIGTRLVVDAIHAFVR